MSYKISLNKIEEIISKTHFANDGDYYERSYWTFFRERFPNCETFWRYFVVSFTKRVELEVRDSSERIRPREGISEDIIDVASFHYSMFLNLTYCYDHLQNFRSSLSSFEDFYMHLASVCDLTEEFLLKSYLLILECRGQKSETLQELSKGDFLKLAEKWYDDNYSKAYEDYLKKGRSKRVILPTRKNVLDEYFEEQEDLKCYKRHSDLIRQYRNIVVHNTQIARILTPVAGVIPLVPKKERIQDYKKWSQVFAVRQDIQKLKNDFINMIEQMTLDIAELETILNSLWTKPVDELKMLFFTDKNKVLLKKYNIELV